MIEGSPWDVLGIPPTTDRSAIRRAYARLLKAIDAAADPDSFQVLRRAYEAVTQRNGTSDASAIPPKTRSAHHAQANVFSKPTDPDKPSHSLDRHWKLLSDLEGKFLGDQAFDASSLEAQLNGVLQSPSLTDLQVYDDTERRLARIVAENVPLSDPMIPHLIHRFGWEDRARVNVADPAVNLIIERADDLIFLRGIRSVTSSHHSAYVALSKSRGIEKPWDLLIAPDLPRQVEALLSIVANRRRSLFWDFDTEAVARWQRYFTKPHFSPWAVWVILVLPPVTLAVEFCRTEFSREEWFKTTLVAVLTTIVLGAVYGYGIEWPRRVWKSRWSFNAPAIARYGWAPSFLILSLLAATLPDSNLARGRVIAGGLIALVWVLVVGEPDRRPFRGRHGDIPWFLTAIHIVPGVMFAWWIIVGPPVTRERYLNLSAAMAASVIAVIWGATPLIHLWNAALRNKNRTVYAVLGMAALAAATTLGWFTWAEKRTPFYIILCTVLLIFSISIPTTVSRYRPVLYWRVVHIILGVFSLPFVLVSLLLGPIQINGNDLKNLILVGAAYTFIGSFLVLSELAWS